MEATPPRVFKLLKLLQHPTRLQILMLLSEEEMPASVIASRLGVSPKNANHMVRDLVEAGYVEVASVEPVAGSGNMNRRIYRGRRSDWAALISCVERFAVGD